MNLLVDIIIVKYNNKEVEDDCIKSVLEHTKGNYHLTIYDNYPENHNLGKLWNRLIKQSDAEYVCVLNSDTIVTEGWLEKMMESFELIEDVGVVGPSTDNARNHQADKVNEILIDYGKTYPNWMLSGFCLLFPKTVIEAVGGFPEDFGFYGQEVSLIKRLEDNGFKQIWRTDAFVRHVGSSSAKKAEADGEFDEKKERAEAKVRLKSIIPRYNKEK